LEREEKKKEKKKTNSRLMMDTLEEHYERKKIKRVNSPKKVSLSLLLFSSLNLILFLSVNIRFLNVKNWTRNDYFLTYINLVYPRFLHSEKIIRLRTL
jgi:hypothetical protein